MLVQIGDVYDAKGDLASARAVEEENLALRTKLAAANPDAAALRIGLAKALSRHGHASLRLGDTAGAATRPRAEHRDPPRPRRVGSGRRRSARCWRSFNNWIQSFNQINPGMYIFLKSIHKAVSV